MYLQELQAIAATEAIRAFPNRKIMQNKLTFTSSITCWCTSTSLAADTTLPSLPS